MLPTNDIARLRIEDWLREADHHRLVREAKAARNASHPERSGVLAAVRRASAVVLRLVPWKHEPRRQTGGVNRPAQITSSCSTGGRA
jgi:hypothetical protein